ncbi:unnamed protein product [Callosobruchus maculatus]|uniref:Peptidase C1A papain C-terminal domain-containing protein n=1 Tax=Callosobruchus maculatus TaxID=64391 RepID=A0A653CHC5_CALMS|nr:unnamed protein product [Callosobruchus maculatus]
MIVTTATRVVYIIELKVDRICIHSNGKDQVRISALDLSCCKQCSSKGLCKGGTIDEAFVYWAKTGIVTGGEVRRNQTDL